MQLIIQTPQNQKETFIITNKQPLRQNHYYKVYQVKQKKSKHNYLLVQFIAMARPSLHIYEIYQSLALPTSIITKELTDYMMHCYKENILTNKCGNFVQYFLGRQNKDRSILHDKQKLSLWQFVEAWTKNMSQQVKMQNQTIIKAKEMTHNSLRSQLKNDIKEQLFSYYKRKSQKALYAISTASSQQKITKIQQICHQLSPLCGSAYYTSLDNKSTYILMDAIKQDSSLSIIEVTVADLINKKYKINFEMRQEDLQKIAIEMFNKNYLFKSKSKSKSYDFKIEKTHLTYYFLNPHNVFIRLIKRQGSNKYELHQNPCELDYIYPFITELGLSSHTTTTQQTIMMSTSLHPIFNIDDLETSFYKQWNQNYQIEPSQLMQCYAILHWIGLIDYMSIKLLNRPQDEDRRSLIHVRKGETIIKMINQNSKYLSSLPSLLLTTFRMEFCTFDLSFMQQLSYQRFNDLFQGLLKQKDEKPATHYYKVELFIKFKELIFSQRQGLKYFIEKSKILTFVETETRLMIIYMICKWAVFSTYKEILEYKGTKLKYIRKMIKEDKNLSKSIGQTLNTFQNIIKKIETKSEERKTKKNQQLSKKIQPYLDKNIQWTSQTAKSQEDMANGLKKYLDGLKKKIYKQFTDIHNQIVQHKLMEGHAYKKNIFFIVMFLEVDSDKYAEFCSIYDNIINNTMMTAQKKFNIEDVNRFYSQDQEKLENSLGKKGKLFWKQKAAKQPIDL